MRLNLSEQVVRYDGHEEDCHVCHGSGKDHGKTCGHCHGSGHEPEHH